MQPNLTRGGIAVIDPKSATLLRVIALQYNPESVSRSLQIQAVGPDGDRLEALRLKGPPNETIKVDISLDAADQLEFPQKHVTTTKFGIFPELAALETLVYPTTAALNAATSATAAGSLEIAPIESPLALFVWSRSRVVPVRVIEFNITEELFDTSLNPIRAKVSLGMRVLSVNDLGVNHRGANLFMAYLANKERFARLAGSAPITSLGIRGIG
jgi:hypothetical protein